MPRWIESGDPRTPVWLIGEAPGAEEIAAGVPLVGMTGQETDRMLREAGWPADFQFFRTNICHERPPSYRNKVGKIINNDIEQFFASAREAKAEGLSPLNGRNPRAPIRDGLGHLGELVSRHRPQLIIALGGAALWGLCGLEGITKWRGSVLSALSQFAGVKVIATLHASAILQYSYTMRPVAVQDFRRALRESAFPEIRKPSWSFVTAPTLADAKDWLRPMIERQTPLVADIEGWGVVDDIGFACSATEAICIPFVREEGGVAPYWGEDDAVEVLGICIEALSTCPITFHNAIFDMQVLCRRWGVAPKLTDDTMVMQHVLFPGMLGGKIDPTTGKVDKKGSSLSLSFIASMYCEYYRYWKDDGRVRDGDYDDQTYWRYNCEDCVRTFECRETLSNALRATNLWEQYRFEMSLFGPVLDMMFRGLRCDQTRVKALRAYTDKHLTAEESWLTESLGFPLNVGSAPQMHALFYEDLGCAVIKDRSTQRPTVDDGALELIARRHPLLLPLCRKIQNIRGLNVNARTFISAFEEAGDRIRFCLNPTGAETMRFSSNETAFGEGTNMQNLTRPVDE